MRLPRELAIMVATLILIAAMLAVAPSITTGMIALAISSALNLWLVAPWMRA